MRISTLLKSGLLWSLAFLAAWITCAIVVLSVFILYMRVSFTAGLQALWTNPHLIVALAAVPIGILCVIWLSILNRWIQDHLERHRKTH
jgi:hypothetical protein